MSYKHLTINERIKIEVLQQEGVSLRRIAKILGFHHSTISRELKRCSNQYEAIYAQKDKIKKSSLKVRKPIAEDKLTKSIAEKLHKKCSPEQIANTICKDVVCFKTIYNWIYSGVIDFDVSKLRRKGKSRKAKETRGRFNIGKSIEKEQKKSKKGIKALTGKPLPASSIRAILRQEKYTGNSLLQKTYTDFISKKEMKNEEELPMYWSEDTHLKIIELEVYEKVQKEIARRRQLGARANMSLNITCFTSNIHCSCGRNFQRNQRNKKDGSKGKYVVWMCVGQKDANRKGCINPSTPEYILKNKCCEVLGVENFSEEIFYKNIKDINVLEPGLLEFVFIDGRKEKIKWKSTAKKDWWTDEARLKYAKLRQSPEFSRKINRFNHFSSFVKCEKCGKSYSRQKDKYANGEEKIYYYCSSPSSKCKNSTIHLSVLKSLIAEELELDSFDSKIMIDKISKLGIKDNVIYFYYKDGKITNRKYSNPVRPKPKHSEETKRKIGKANKKR